MKNDFGKSEYGEFIIDRAKSRQAIDTQIDRIDDELRKHEGSEEIHGLEREAYRNTADGKKYYRSVKRWIIAPFQVCVIIRVKRKRGSL